MHCLRLGSHFWIPCVSSPALGPLLPRGTVGLASVTKELNEHHHGNQPSTQGLSNEGQGPFPTQLPSPPQGKDANIPTVGWGLLPGALVGPDSSSDFSCKH